MQNLNRIHLNGLRAIEAVGRLGSLQAAADEINVTPGAISQHVSRAEAQIGRRLFERTARGLEPTPIGLEVLARLSPAFRLMSEAVRLAEQRDRSVLTISVAPVFASRWLVRRLDGFTALYPDIRLRIEATTNLTHPGQDDVDLAIRVGDGSWSGVRVERILEQKVFPVTSPELGARIRSAEDLLGLPVVIDSRSMLSWAPWLSAAGLGGARIEARHAYNEASLCLDAVIAGQGVMLAWQTLAVDAIAEGRLAVPVALRVPTGFGHYFVTAEDGREPPGVRAFKAWMRAEIAACMAPLDALFASVSGAPQEAL